MIIDSHCHLNMKDFSYEIESHEDSRGSFVEMLKTRDSGQFSYFTAFPLVLIFIILFWVLIPSSFGFIFKMKENFTYVIFIALFNIAFIMFYWIKFSRKIVPRLITK